jgi:hypothetical protein
VPIASGNTGNGGRIPEVFLLAGHLVEMGTVRPGINAWKTVLLLIGTLSQKTRLVKVE